MRLSKIRLSGFKSFVDATPVPFPASITAIVGPNGCGKSNIIDAVRWVMGESSAKHLRGGSMTDVIFSGSGTRKPVGQASIELLFDNTDGTLGGQYAAYTEISVRRQVNRDGQSVYYLNGTRCRRRDVTEVFLGTGLGPRSYSIIEQGTISRLIEARPEELRGYLEEAAGISLYKERRRETERRMRDTRENLERLEDVRGEVGTQLEKLTRQAEVAEKYRALKAEERQRQAELLLLRIQAIDKERTALATELSERNTALEARLADQRRVERELEVMRARHVEDSEQVNAVQGQYYQIGADIARAEQAMAHRRELRENSRKELERNQLELERISKEMREDIEKKDLFLARVSSIEPEKAALEADIATAEEQLKARQKEVERIRAECAAIAQQQANAERSAQVEGARIEQLEDRLYEQNRRRERLAETLEQLAQTEAEEEQAVYRAEADELEAQRREQTDVLQRIDSETQTAKSDAQAAGDQLDQAKAARATTSARLTSLETLQESALGADEQITDWVRSLGLSQPEKVVEHLVVEPGWERAVEIALADALQAVVTESYADLLEGGAALPRGRAMFVESAKQTAAPAPTALLAKIESKLPLASLLSTVHVAETDAEAHVLLADLPAGQSVITQQGRWFGHHWARVIAADDGVEAGVLERRREIEGLTAQIKTHDQTIVAANEQLEASNTVIVQREAERAEAQAVLAKIGEAMATCAAKQQAAAERIQEVERQRESLTEERADLLEAIEAGQRAVTESRSALDQAMQDRDTAEAATEKAIAQRDESVGLLDAERQALDELRQRQQDASLRLEGAQTAAASIEQAIARLQRSQDQFEARNAELGQALETVAGSDDDLEQERQTLLTKRVEVEAELTVARQRLGEADAAIRELDQQRAAAEQEVNGLRESAETARFRDYEIEARRNALQEQLAGFEVSADGISNALPENATEAAWQTELERLDNRIRRLGPINLAAIDEHQALAERKEYLDEQFADLTEALDTLQDAIQKIDRETRTRFKETFEKVNAGLQRLFPRLFGGGQAYLEMTEDDLLETGITIMARPPGKRITNIHLLSGGEKALTAVSLVFAIFELNPAPFCMLDEVDAPLDEANVGRFCDLLREMSSRVQFIVITHNKTTMEAATHLAGVTMAEPGVSRLVAVDVAEALTLAEAEAET
ncbi:MAG: chromosome segregation protein SMC [Gammaproteobacteria bacterium]|nr:chromosome segregation protein SMC [Gammaproteobacteria bacterium]